ncbi:ribonuclease H-like domain-containing protein, partial [Tanacetum coccineum]
MGIVDGTCVKKESSVVLSQQWEICNVIVLWWNLGSLTQELYVGQVYSEIAFEVWTELKETYAKMDGSVVFNIMHRINKLKQGDLSIPDYYHKLNSHWREFDILTILHPCVSKGRIACTYDAKSGSANHTHLIRLMQFLMGLNDVYQPIISTILAKDHLLNVKDAFYVVSREESHRRLHPCGSGILICLDNLGITIKDYVPSTSSSLSSSFSNEQMMKLLSLINEKPSPSANMSDISSLMLTVGHPNGTLAKITAIGSLRLTSGIVQFDVFEYNDLKLGKIIGTGSETSGLYFKLWYCKLGYPSDQVLSILGKQLDFSKSDHISPCDICHKAKQTREPFPLSNHKSKYVGDIVHCDVWGPYRVVRKDGNTYFLTLVDDFSRAIWVYLLKDVKFYENIFPFKLRLIKSANEFDVLNEFEVHSLKFFDTQRLERPYDEEGGTPNMESNGRVASDECDITVDDEAATIATQIRENIPSEGNVHSNQNGEDPTNILEISLVLRRSSRQRNMPSELNDFIVGSSVRYGLEKYVCYSKLSGTNFCFSTILNKYFEPKTYLEASQNPKWVETMNLEMETLHRNNSYVLAHLPPGRKVKGCKWIWNI